MFSENKFLIYKDESGNFVKSEDFDVFLITSFLISSYCKICAKNKITSTNHNIPKMTKEDLIKCLDFSELKDCQNLVKVFNETFFDKDSLNYFSFLDNQKREIRYFKN